MKPVYYQLNFHTPEAKKAVKVKAAQAGVSMNQYILDCLNSGSYEWITKEGVYKLRPDGKAKEITDFELRQMEEGQKVLNNGFVANSKKEELVCVYKECKSLVTDDGTDGWGTCIDCRKKEKI